MITAVIGVMLALTAYFAVVFFMDFFKTKKEGRLESGNFLALGAVGLVANFFDTLGIGSFATTSGLYKIFHLSEDRTLPGTLNVSCTIPVVVEAVCFMTVIKVEPVTLIAMLAAATIGAFFGAGFVSKLDERKVELGMGGALIVVAIVMTCKQLGIMPAGGTAIGLTGGALIAGVIGNLILGALMTLGIGLYAPCMALVFALGMSPKVAFPIMMGSCAFLMPVASAKFVKEGAYDRKASMATIIFGTVGVLIAVYVVKSLPLNVLTWVVIVVVAYTAILMLRSAAKHKKAA